MTRIIINGHSFEFEGSLSQINGKWYDGAGREIDMNNLEGVKESKTINITIEGNVDKLSVSCCSQITVNGNCRSVQTGSGDINCQNIEGGANTGSGDITCDTIEGNANTGTGDIKCNNIGGRATSATGSVSGGRQRSYGSQTVFAQDNSDIHVGESESFDTVIGSLFGRGGAHVNRCVAAGEVISGGFTMTRTPDGKKHMTLHKDCTVNGRRIGDMSEEELNAWIAEKAKKGKIITIL